MGPLAAPSLWQQGEQGQRVEAGDGETWRDGKGAGSREPPHPAASTPPLSRRGWAGEVPTWACRCSFSRRICCSVSSYSCCTSRWWSESRLQGTGRAPSGPQHPQAGLGAHLNTAWPAVVPVTRTTGRGVPLPPRRCDTGKLWLWGWKDPLCPLSSSQTPAPVGVGIQSWIIPRCRPRDGGHSGYPTHFLSVCSRASLSARASCRRLLILAKKPSRLPASWGSSCLSFPHSCQISVCLEGEALEVRHRSQDPGVSGPQF